MDSLLGRMGRDGLIATLSFGLLVGWVISVLYEGPLLYAMALAEGVDGTALDAADLLLLAVGLLAGTAFTAPSPAAWRERLLRGALLCFLGTLALPFLPGAGLYAAFPLLSLAAGWCMAAWGHLLKAAVPVAGRTMIAPGAMTLACLVLTPVHVLTGLLDPRAGFALAAAGLGAHLLLLKGMGPPAQSPGPGRLDAPRRVLRRFWVLYLSIFLITTNAGFMFQAVYPLFAEHQILACLYTNVPYVAAVLACAALPSMRRLQTLYGGLALWGLSLIMFTNFDLSVATFFAVISCMLFAAGLFDFFWWSIFTRDLEAVHNPATLVGTILAATILGSLAGGQATNLLAAAGVDPARMAQWGLVAILLNMVLIGAVNRRLAPILLNQGFLEDEQIPDAETQRLDMVREKLSPREMEVFRLLRCGLSNKDICSALHISLNTVKTHNRKIFSKLGVQDRTELQRKFPAAPAEN